MLQWLIKGRAKSQPAFSFLKSAVETPEQCVKLDQFLQ